MLYPFTAIVGQDEMKLALLLNAINPSIGGVLIEGEKGTAKSTACLLYTSGWRYKYHYKDAVKRGRFCYSSRGQSRG